MKIEDGKGNRLESMEDWSRLYDTAKQRHHWKQHRSAWCAADFVLNRDGVSLIRERLHEILGQTVSLDRVVPEFEQRFDEYGRGRVHDLGIFGVTSAGKSLFVGVEAKVDESFGPRVQEAYLTAKARQITGESTKAPERIEGLLARHFMAPDPGMFDVRYQLLYGTAGTLAVGADVSVFYVAVFRTPLYDDSIGAQNFRDYANFIQRIEASPIQLSDDAAMVHEARIDGSRLFCVHEVFAFE